MHIIYLANKQTISLEVAQNQVRGFSKGYFKKFSSEINAIIFFYRFHPHKDPYAICPQVQSGPNSDLFQLRPNPSEPTSWKSVSIRNSIPTVNIRISSFIQRESHDTISPNLDNGDQPVTRSVRRVQHCPKTNPDLPKPDFKPQKIEKIQRTKIRKRRENYGKF